MLDQDFCTVLEYRLCNAFSNTEDQHLRGFWCDGVLLSESDKCYSQQFVSDNKLVKMKAFLGKEGQTEYSVRLKFGNKALSRYARNLDIVGCIPETVFEDWIKIDTAVKVIEIQLD